MFRRQRLALAFCLLAAPAGAEPDPLAVVAELPFLASEQANRVYVDLAKPDSHRRLRVLLDTGAVFSVFTPRAAREIGVRPKRLKPDPYRRATSLGRDLQFLIDTSTSETASKTGWEYGLLGGNFLDDYVVELDFPGRRVRFLDPRRYEVPRSSEAADEAVIPLEIVSSRPGLRVKVNGRPMTLLLDTGAPLGLMLSGELAARGGAVSAPVPDFHMGGAMLAKAETELGEVATLEIGPFRFERVPAVVAPQGWFNIGFPGESMLGYDLLAQFQVRIDYRRGRLWLRRVPGVRMTFLGGDVEVFRAGALLHPHEAGPHVSLVRPDSPASTLGLAPGDRIVSPRDDAQILQVIRTGGGLVVERSVDGDTQALVLAPEPTPAEATAGTP